MRKVIAAAGVAAVALTSCSAEVRDSGGGGGQDGGPIELAVVPKAIGFDFWESVRLGAECAASKLEGVDIQWDGVTQETDVSGQQNLLQNLVTQGVDGLVYAATDAKVLSDVSRSALDSGVTVVNIDSGTQPQPEQVPVYATDNVAAAELATRYLAEQLGGRGKVAFIPFQPGTATNDTRTEGFMNGLRANPGLQLVAQQSSDSDYNQALQVTQDILTANPDLNGIYAANEPSVLGAAEAVRQAGRAGQVKIVGWDTASEEIAGVREGVISAVVAQNPFRMGYDGVNAAVDKIRDGRPAPGGDTGAVLITRDNVDAPEVAALLDPSCENPPRVGPGS
ncbi:MAG: substrate-binding domain-containing protein [Pseudonocardiaceae bacterium]